MWLARTRSALAALVVVVTAAHLWLADVAGRDRFGLGAGSQAVPPRMRVAFVRELKVAAPRALPAATAGVAAAALAPQQASLRPPPVAPVAASQPVIAAAPAEPASTAPLLTESPAAAAPLQVVAASQPGGEADAAVAVAVQPAASQPQAASSAEVVSAEVAGVATTAFAWPPSTRLSYTLSGNYRGPVEGLAQVEWLLEGGRYQVHMDLSIGPAFAPLASRRVSSEGQVTPQGLSPRRYDETTTALFRQPQKLTVWLDAEQVRLANGRVEARPPGVQDSASQFVHLTWLFTTQPTLLRAGQSVTLPLALPRQLQNWVYDVLGAETLTTPAGDLETFHVKPRRPQRQDLTAEIWVAPSLQYLPVRIVIRQDESTYLDLLIARLPQQAETRR